MRALGESCFFLGIVLLSAAIGLAITGIRMTGEAFAVNVVSMKDNLFQPQTVTVAAGATVEWRNEGQLPHTATSDAGVSPSWDSGILRSGQTYRLDFEAPGTYAYKCDVHPEMIGALVVEASAPPAQDSQQNPPAETAPPSGGDPSSQPAAAGAGAPPSSSGAGAAPAPAALSGALPVGGGLPPLESPFITGSIALSVAGGALMVLGLIALGGGAVLRGKARRVS